LSDTDLYTGREQTLVKHFILRQYLERFAIIVGTHRDTLTYVDCFSGPWNVQSEDFKDSSFSIALEQLRKARRVHQDRTGRTLRLRCLFLEKSRSAFTKLKQFTDKITDVEIEPQNKKLEHAIPLILEFVRKGGSRSFPFIFIDPTGWTGFEMGTIAPLLKIDPGEVLINFMTGHIRRFIDYPEEVNQQSFVRFFGSEDFREKVKGLAQQEREDAAVEEYIRNVKSTGNFPHVCSAIVLHPEIDRTAFHLIYATRNLAGVEVFKDAEKRAMALMEKARAEAKQRKREEKTRQTELYSGEVLHDPIHYTSLRVRYLAKSKQAVLDLLETHIKVPYDQACALTLSFPLSWESDLKEWIRSWSREGLLTISGLKARQHVPQRGQGILLVWRASRERRPA
jgi:three-Cys-motif partner protein